MPDTAHHSGKPDQLEQLAAVFMPADPSAQAVFMDSSHSLEEAMDSVVSGTVMWGAAPQKRSGPSAVVAAARMKKDLLRLTRAVPGGVRASIHPIPPRQLQTLGIRAQAVRQIKSGALVEITTLALGERIIDVALVRAGIQQPLETFIAGSGGTVVAFVESPEHGPCVFRIANALAPGNPDQGARILDQLQAAGVTLAPTILDRGSVETGVSETRWTLERRLAGSRPSSLGPALMDQATELLAAFPGSAGPPTVLTEELTALALLAPEFGDLIRDVITFTEEALAEAPAVLRHGDFWSGNLLVEGDQLTGVVDWDGAHFSGVPGADLMHLLSTELREASGQFVGEFLTTDPWTNPSIHGRLTSYFDAVGWAGGPERFRTTGIAWWSAAVAGTVARFPERINDANWCRANVELPLDYLATSFGVRVRSRGDG